MLGSLAANVIEPMFRLAWASVIGFQLAPASRLVQIPPLALPSNQWLASEGSIATALTRPVGPLEPRIDEGPRLVQVCAWQTATKQARIVARLLLITPPERLLFSVLQYT